MFSPMLKPYLVLLLVLGTVTAKVNAQTYNYYFGNIHAHSSYSDGNQDSSTSMMTKPLQDFNYAKSAQHIDFYGISEHNHYSAGMTNPLNYYKGLADANAATVNGSFVALYGMEWGVISGGGHVIVYGYDSLIGWDGTGSQVHVPQNDYAGLWKKLNEKPGAFAYLAHPQSTDYGSLLTNTVNLSADNAIVGMAARSGPAFSTNTSYSNPASGTYISRYNDALKRGYHLGVGLDHDSHNSVFGKQTAGRLVVLATSLTRASVLDAIQKMRFYSSDDWNLRVNFTINNMPMGSSITYTGSPTLKVSVIDPDVSENVSSIAVYYGVPGSGVNAALLSTVTNTANLSYVHTIVNNNTYYYYLKITQTDGNIVWTSPIWYTRNDAVTNSPPVTNFSASSTTVCVGQSITFTDNTTNGPADWNWTLTGALPNTSTHQNVIATYYSPGTYTINLSTSNTFGTGASKINTITVVPLPNVVVIPDTICSGETATLTAMGANTYSWSTGATTAIINIAPTVSTIYNVTGTLTGCSKKINAYVIVNGCVGIEELSKELIKIYPNPANQILTIDLHELATEKTIEIYDEFGKLVLSKTTVEPLLKLDVSTFHSGIYLVKVILKNHLYALDKFMIERK